MNFKIMCSHDMFAEKGIKDPSELGGHGVRTIEKAHEYVELFSGTGKTLTDSPRMWVEITTEEV